MTHPLRGRYPSTEMTDIWTPKRKFSTWRQLWVYLAEAQQELGLDIDDGQIEEMRNHVEITDEEMEHAKQYEKKLKHDVMAHVHVYGETCSSAKPVIHLGATSMYVGDNTDLMRMREALELIRDKAVCCVHRAAEEAEKYKNIPCLGRTHLQPAQVVTVGKRIAFWAEEMYLALEDVQYRLDEMKFRGAKGTTGTQASFLKLFDGDSDKVQQLDQLVTEKAGFKDSHRVIGQTYPRVVDYQILSSLAQIDCAVKKAGNDIRLLQMLHQVEEPFSKKQVGSSAMPYKRNPTRSERDCSLSRYLFALPSIAAANAGEQFLERTLDDSANRRIIISDAFCATDAVLDVYKLLMDGLVVYPKVIEKELEENMPFMATENIIMQAVNNGADRQECHERVRRHSMDTVGAMRQEGADNDLLDRLAEDDYLSQFLDPEDIRTVTEPRDYVGRAPEQVDEFVSEVVEPMRERYPDALEFESGVEV